jgi:hypothetical protein
VSGRAWYCLPAAVAALVLFLASSAQGALVTLGSPLTVAMPPTAIGGSGPSTFANTFFTEPFSVIYAPKNGTLVSWRFTGAVGGPFRLRILHSQGGSPYMATAVASSAPQTPTGTGTQTFALNLPIQMGDLIALDDSAPSDMIGTSTSSNGVVQAWVPALADGATAAPSLTFVNRELGFNADLRPVSHRFTLGKIKRNKRRGTATLTAAVPDPGGLVLFGKGLKKITATATAPGKVKMRVKPNGAAKRELNESGRAKVKAKVKFSPIGISPDTEAKELTLRKRL